jgi:hypothetical protein
LGTNLRRRQTANQTGGEKVRGHESQEEAQVISRRARAGWTGGGARSM